jgi:hypothetical protein
LARARIMPQPATVLAGGKPVLLAAEARVDRREAESITPRSAERRARPAGG